MLMSNDTILEKIKQALQKLYQNDLALIGMDAHEQTVAHRLAVYLEQELSENLKENGLSVDCEYNKHLDNEKYLFAHNPAYSLCEWEILAHKFKQEYRENKTMRPDIMVHRRGDDTHNLCVIELEKKHHKHTDIDSLKLTVLTDLKLPFKYMQGYLITYAKSTIDLTVFVDGKISSSITFHYDSATRLLEN